ncbi:MAG: holo-ACP synthase [Deltaproteobacteria bacterium]|nr:holo-ACP synthase [Deltaproteobacteria bacterium]
MIGIDIVDTQRIKKLFEKKGEKFLDRILSQEEKDYVLKKKRFVESISGIFAAKEAFMKAIKKKVPFTKIRIVHEDGKPCILYENLLYKNVSISHEKNYAVSVVIVP